MFGYIKRYVRNPIIAGVCCGLIGIFMAYVDDEVRDNQTKKTTETYLKIFFMCFTITSFLVYMVVDVYVSNDEFYGQNFHKTLNTDLMPSKGGYSQLPQKTLNQPPDNVFSELDKLQPGLNVPLMPHKDYISTDIPKTHHGKSHRNRHR